jgi:hypothetical protein
MTRPKIVRDKQGHLLRGPQPRLGHHLATCLRCGRNFQTPIEKYEREICAPDSPSSLSKRLWLDDLRTAPWGYDLVAKTADECIEMLKTHVIRHCSLDHDLAPEHYPTESTGYYEPPIDRSAFKEKTGYDVLAWMQESGAWVPEIHVHTLNARGAEDMLAKLKNRAPEWVVYRRVWPRER